MKSKQQGLTAPAPARALPDDDEPTIGDLQRELARLRLSRDTWKTRAQKAARRLIDALPDHASCASAELRVEMPAGEFSVRISEPGAEG